MSRDNEIFIRGRVFDGPETRGAVVTFRVSVNSYRKKKDARPDDQYPNETNWFRVTCFRKLHDDARALRKGDICEVVGSLEFSSWEKDGVKRESAEIHADSVAKVERGSTSSGAGSRAGSGTAQQPQQRAQAAASAPAAGEFFEEDDCPF